MQRTSSDSTQKLTAAFHQGDEIGADRLTHIFDVMTSIDMGKDLVNEVANTLGYHTMFIDKAEESKPGKPATLANCNPDKRLITLNSRLCDDQAVACLCHEMRHAVQMANGGRAFPRRHDAYSYLLMTQAGEADAEAYMTEFTYRLKEKGHDGPWKAIDKRYPHLTTAFEKTLKENPASLDNGLARRSAFYAWYQQKDITSKYEENYTNGLKAVAEDNAEAFFYFDMSVTAKEAAEAICRHKTEGCYLQEPDRIAQSPQFSISKESQGFLKRFMDNRFYKTEMKRDTSIDKIPVRTKNMRARRATRQNADPALSAQLFKQRQQVRS